ncbi:MAG: hypothetical protein ACTTJC_02045 [Campylobacter sp.]
MKKIVKKYMKFIAYATWLNEEGHIYFSKSEDYARKAKKIGSAFACKLSKKERKKLNKATKKAVVQDMKGRVKFNY